MRPVAVAALICGLILLLGNRVLAIQGPFWVGSSTSVSAPPAPTPPPTPGSSCGGEAAPPQAVAAGFTTCIMNFDFTQTTGSTWLSPYNFSGPVATIANWLDCADTDTTKPWHWLIGPACNGTYVSVVNDPVTGGLTLKLFNNTATNMLLAGVTNAYNGTSTPGMPAGFYLSGVFRSDTGMNGDSGVATWQPFISAAANAWQTEIYPDSGGNPRVTMTSGCGYTGSTPNCGNYGGLFWGTPGFDNPCFQIPAPCPLTGVPGFTPHAYHEYGFLVTVNAALNGYAASAYVDNVFQSSVSGNYYRPGNYTQPNYPFLTNGDPSFGASAGGNMYYQNVHAWACSSPKTTQCPGTVLVNGPPPRLTYYH